jgi:hypothetical protein
VADVDGLETDLATVADNFYDAKGRALTANVVLWPQIQTVFMNRTAFEALTPEQQGILRRAGREAVEAVLTDIESEEKAALAAVCERRRLAFVTASPADLVALRKSVEPVYAELERDGVTKNLIGEITELRGESPAQALSCPGRHGGLNRNALTLEGRWRYGPTRQDLLNVGMSPREAEMLGASVMFAFADGRFEIIAGGDVAATGRYTEEGDVVNIVFETGPPVAPRRHVFRLNRSIYRDQLTFSTVPGREPLLYLIARPLTRAR